MYLVINTNYTYIYILSRHQQLLKIDLTTDKIRGMWNVTGKYVSYYINISYVYLNISYIYFNSILTSHISITFHISILTFHISTLKFHISILTFHISILTFHLSIYSFAPLHTSLQDYIIYCIQFL